MQGIKKTALAFDRACRNAEIPYVFIGGLAVMAWGQPRATTDVDTLIRLKKDQLERFQRHLSDEGLDASPQDFLDSLGDGSHVTVFDREGGFHVDVKLARNSDEEAEIDRAILVSMTGGHVRVARPEDVVAFKLSFGSPQDLQDARSILVRQKPHLDIDMLKQMASRLGTTSLLEALLEELEYPSN